MVSHPTPKEIITDYHQGIPLWDLSVEEIIGRNIESRGRNEVNDLLQQGWVLLHIYTLKYKENETWRERPMAILGRPSHVPSLKQPH